MADKDNVVDFVKYRKAAERAVFVLTNRSSVMRTYQFTTTPHRGLSNVVEFLKPELKKTQIGEE